MLGRPLRRALALLLALAAALVWWQQGALNVLALSRIDPLPQTRELITQARYAEAAERLDFFLAYDYVRADPAAQALRDELAARRQQWGYQFDKVTEGVITGSSDELAGQIAGVATDLLVIGDLRDLSRQAVHWVRDDETDEVVVALASLGLAASAAQLVTGPGGTAFKAGVVTLKRLRKQEALPSWLGGALVAALAQLRQTGETTALRTLMTDVDAVARVRGGDRLLASTTDRVALRRMAGFTAQQGGHSALVYQLAGPGVVRISWRLGAAGRDAVRLAAVFGRAGLHTLERVGVLTFTKYAARLTRTTYQGRPLALLARALTGLPTWLLPLLMLSALLVMWPTSIRSAMAR